MTETPRDRCSLTTLEAFRSSCDQLLGSARRNVRILSPNLDLALLSRASVATALADLTRASRFTDIRILFADSLLAMKHGHRLIELSRRFPSSISLRQLPVDRRDEQNSWILTDDANLIWRPEHVRYDNGFCESENRELAPRLCRQFDDIWERSQPDPELRRLFL
ncbi:MAG: hypothetical protein P1U67_03540 [Alcanivoracaceae bacterium]|nr:hypothetical protein [Alcanivoracaceae bacterium]